MRYVSMLWFRRFQVPVFEPFLQLTGLPDLHWRQPRTDLNQCGGEIFINSQNLRGLDALRKQVAQDLHIHCRARADGHTCRMNILW